MDWRTSGINAPEVKHFSGGLEVVRTSPLPPEPTVPTLSSAYPNSAGIHSTLLQPWDKPLANSPSSALAGGPPRYVPFSVPPPIPQSGPSELDTQTRRQKAAFGISPWLLAAIAAFVGMLLSGAVVGGVLGLMVKRAEASCASTNGASAQLGNGASCPGVTTITTTDASGRPTTATATRSTSTSTAAATALQNYVAAPSESVATLQWTYCPAIDKSTKVAFRGARFGIECGIDTQGAGKEASGLISVIVAVSAYSLEACLDACASLNNRGLASPKCRSVVFRREMADNVSNGGGNCFLKNATRAAGNDGLANEGAITGSLLS